MTYKTILLIFTVKIFLPKAKPSDSVRLLNADYERKIGYILVGEPYQRLTSNRLIHCIMTCTNSLECNYMNVLHENSATEAECEFFNMSTMVDEPILISSEISTFYTKSTIFKDCFEAKAVIKTAPSGIYNIMLPYKGLKRAFCDMKTDQGGWTLLQRRFDGSVDFYRDWQSYKIGFGNLETEFWLGLEAAHLLMKNGNVTLRFDLWDGQTYYFMEYYEATIADETDNYRLNWVGFSGNASDSMTVHNNKEFTTKDKDNDLHDQNCSIMYKGGWWYAWCHSVNLNGIYGSTVPWQAMIWEGITGNDRSLSKTEIKVKLNG